MYFSTRAFLCCLAVGTAAFAGEQPFRVIVNPANPAASLTREQVSGYFLKLVTRWPSGAAVRPVELSRHDAVEAAFSRAALGKTPSELDVFWQQRTFSGAANRPTRKPTDAEVVAYVRGEPNAIGFVSSEADLTGVKELTVLGDDGAPLVGPPVAPASGHAAGSRAAEVTLMLGALAHERSFTARGPGGFTVLVVADEPGSAEVKRLLGELVSLAARDFAGRRPAFAVADSSDAALQRALDSSKVEVLLAVEVANPAAVAAAARARKVAALTLGGGRVEDGFLLGVAAGTPPQLVLNVTVAAELDATFDSSLLRIVRIVR